MKFFAKIACVILALSCGIAVIPQKKVSAGNSDLTVTLDQKNFPDDIFRQYVSSSFDKNGDGELSKKEISKAKIVYIANPDIKDISGVEFLKSLKSLYIFDCSMPSVDLKDNVALKNLTIRSDKITELDLTQNKNLKNLDICGNKGLKKLDLSRNTELKKFWFSAETLKDLTLRAGTKFESIPYSRDLDPSWSTSNKKVAKLQTETEHDSYGKESRKLILKAGKVGRAKVTGKIGGKKNTLKIRVLYKDLTNPDKFWYKPTYAMFDKGVVKGYEKCTRLKSSNKCTRAQMVTFLWRLEGSPMPKKSKKSRRSRKSKDSEIKFKDVKKSDYFYYAVQWACKKKIMEGFEDGSFKPQRMCARRDTVTFLWNLAGKPEPSSSENRFKDIEPSDPYYKAALWAYETGIISGYSDGTFRPNGNCLRRHALTFIYNYDRNVKSKK